MRFVEGGVVIVVVVDFKREIGWGGEWISSSNKTMLGVVFGSFFAVEESTQFRITEDAGSDEAAPREVLAKQEQCMLLANDTSREVA
jgi:hypothetical protein